MAREVHSKEIDEDQPVVGQERPAVEEPPAPDAEARESRQKETPAGVPSAAAPTPPSGRLAASIQRMPPAGRWALGLALAFLSIFMGWVPGPGGYAVMSVLVLAAGFVLGSWRAMLPAAIAAAAGAFAESWVAVQLVPLNYWGEGLTKWDAVVLILEFTAMFGIIPFFCLLAAGVSMSKCLRSQAPSTDKVMVNWIVALCPVIAGGLLTAQLGNMIGLLSMQLTGGVLVLLAGILFAIMLAATCVPAGWLLRSVKGFVVTPLVYAGAALAGILIISFWSEFTLAGFAVLMVFYILLPAVVMSAIGTAIGGGFPRSSAN